MTEHNTIAGELPRLATCDLRLATGLSLGFSWPLCSPFQILHVDLWAPEKSLTTMVTHTL